MEADAGTEVFKRRYVTLALSDGTKHGRLTEFQMFLWTRKELGNANGEALGKNEVFATVRVRANEEAQHFN